MKEVGFPTRAGRICRIWGRGRLWLENKRAFIGKGQFNQKVYHLGREEGISEDSILESLKRY